MQKYHSTNSGVASFALAEDSITVRFKSGDTYRYDYETPGKRLVEQMKKLARQGRGLSTFISRQVKHAYRAKL
jgi:hypothetical protein